MMEGGAWSRKWKTITAALLLCSLALGLTFLSWLGLTKALKVERSSEVEDAMFNGKEFKSALSVAVGPNMGLNASIQADTNGKALFMSLTVIYRQTFYVLCVCDRNWRDYGR